MQKRKLGKSNLEVSAIGLGCMGMSFGYGPPVDKQEMIALIRAAVERGVTFFDTAEVYGPFTNEELVGEALAPFREQVVIATKFGFHLDPEAIAECRAAGLNSRPEHIKEVAEASLKRLKVEAIDLFYQHRVDPDVPIEDVAGAVKDLIRRARSSTSASPKPACRRSAAPTPSSRSRRSRANTRCGGDAPKRKCCRRSRNSGSASFPFSPLGKGFLTGKIDENTDVRQHRLPQHRPSLYAGGPEGEPGPGRSARRDRGTEEGDARPDRAGLAAGPEAVDRSDPRHHEAGTAWRRTSERPPSNSRPTTSARSTAPPRRSRCKGLGTPKTWSK